MEAGQMKGDKTERVVLERVAFVDPLNDPEESGSESHAWRERGRSTGTKREAIRAVVGNAQGVYRAPSLRSWKGAIEQGEPVVQQRLIDD